MCQSEGVGGGVKPLILHQCINTCLVADAKQRVPKSAYENVSLPGRLAKDLHRGEKNVTLSAVTFPACRSRGTMRNISLVETPQHAEQNNLTRAPLYGHSSRAMPTLRTHTHLGLVGPRIGRPSDWSTLGSVNPQIGSASGSGRNGVCFGLKTAEQRRLVLSIITQHNPDSPYPSAENVFLDSSAKSQAP